MFQDLLFPVVHVHFKRPVSNFKLFCVIYYLFFSQLLPVSWGPSTTWSRWRSQTLRSLTRCRSTLWNARTHQVSHFYSVNHIMTFLRLKREVLTLAKWSIVLLADLSSSPPGLYGQEQYICRPEQHLKAPPILPPHLLQVILNKDTNISVSVFSMSTANISSCLDLSFW